MKHLVKGTDVEGADFGRVILENDEVYLKGFTSSFKYQAVDLGLSVKWCNMNVGASSPEDGGKLFQWGDTQGYTVDRVGNGEGQKIFSSDYSDYKFGTYPDFTKYTGSDGKTVLDPEDDAVRANMGENWRMPTHEEMEELFTNTDLELEFKNGTKVSGTTDSGSLSWDLSSVDLSGEEYNEEYGLYNIKGMRFINRSDSSKSIFVPAAGCAYDGSVLIVGCEGYLWSSSLYEDNADLAWNLYCYSGSAGADSYDYRYIGFPVRAVLAQ